MTSVSLGGAVRQLVHAGVAFAPQIAAAAQPHHLDPELLAAVAAQETGGPASNAGRNVVGDGGHGHGLFQIDDRWHAFARTSAAMNPAQNAEYAASMISGLLKQYGGDVHKALSAYNAGSGNATGTVTQWADGRRLGYADSVLRHYANLTGGAPAHVADAPPRSANAADAPVETKQLQSLDQSTAPAEILQLRTFESASKRDISYAGIISSDDTN